MRDYLLATLTGLFLGLVVFTGYLASTAFTKAVHAEAKQMVMAAYAAGQLQCVQKGQDRGT